MNINKNILTISFIFLILIGNFQLFGKDYWELLAPELEDHYSIKKFIEFDNSIFVAAAYGGVYVSNDDGDTWNPVNNGIEGLIVTTIIRMDNILFAGTNRGGLYKSANDGESWELIDSEIKDYVITDIAVKDGRIIAGTLENGLFVSSDGGYNWINYKDNIVYGYIRTIITNEDAIYSGGVGVYKSTDDGDTWISYNNVIDNKGIVVLYYCYDKLFAGLYSEPGIYISEDLGESWAKQESQPVSELTVDAIFNVGNYLFVSADRKVYMSKDKGESWIDVNSGIEHWKVISFGLKDNYIFAGMADGEIARAELGVIDVEESPAAAEGLYCRIAPNPVSSRCRAEYMLPEASVISLTVYDALGRPVKKLVENEYRKAGSGAAFFSAAGLPAGTYYLVARAGRGACAGRFVVCR